MSLLSLLVSRRTAVFGLVASLATHSLVPYLIGIAFAVPLLLLAVYPRERVIRTMLERLQAPIVARDTPRS